MSNLFSTIDMINRNTGTEVQNILAVMRLNENKRNRVRGNFIDLKKRDSVINYMLEVMDQFQLHVSTVFVAIDYYDRIARQFSSDIKVQGKIGLICLLTAAKYEECEALCPSFSFFCASSHSLFSSCDEMCSYEREILQELRWNMESITVSHYIDIYRMTGVLCDGDTLGGRKLSHATDKYVKEFMQFFLSLSISQPSFSTHLPSIQAAAIVFASRKAAGIMPTWREELTSLVGIPPEKFAVCLNPLWDMFTEKYPKKNSMNSTKSPANVNLL